ncbi:MBG domain-containing protein, partial [Leeuwenhoekiella polynyae]
SSTLANANYNITFVPADLTITEKAITITADAKSKVYGATDPTLTYTVSPDLVGSDVLTGSLSRATGETVGEYAISSTLVNANYNITFVPADLTITEKAITITADAKSKVYGSADPALTYTVSPDLVGSDVLTGSLSRATGEKVGEYAISSTLANANYNITFVPADLTITEKAITITADAKS